MFLVISFIGGQASVFIIIDIFKGEIGSVTDWVSGLGAIFAIFAVEWQINEQRREFNEDKNAEIRVAVGKATIPVKQDGKESEPLKNLKMVIRTYAYNIGYSAGSFIFIGFATKDTLEKIKNFNPHNFGNDPIS